MFLQCRLYDFAGTCYTPDCLKVTQKNFANHMDIFRNPVCYLSLFMFLLYVHQVSSKKNTIFCICISCGTVDEVFFLHDIVSMTHTLQKYCK
jgi:hypothetical protein